jgi:hypothetical protein
MEELHHHRDGRAVVNSALERSQILSEVSIAGTEYRSTISAGVPSWSMRDSLECAECARLIAEWATMRQANALPVARVRAAIGDDSGQYLIMKTLAEDAQMDMGLIELEIMHHQAGHTGPECTGAPVPIS